MLHSPWPIPGFVDLQVNGFLGINFSDSNLTEEKIAEASRALLSRGTAAFLPTVVTGSEEMYERNLPLIARVIKSGEFQGRLLGIHIEGPFISPEPGAVGAHRPDFVRPPSLDLFEKMLDWGDGCIKLLTLAAEIPGADEVAKLAKASGVVVSIGHSLATPEDLDRLALAGANAVTHLGNGLPNLLPRHENFIWAVLANDHYTAMIISDGNHLPEPILKSIIRAKTAERLIVVSDASPIAGLPPGKYKTLGNDVVMEESGRIFNFEKQCLVGSSATMLHCMNHLSYLNMFSLDQMIAVGFKNPLKLIGLTSSDVCGQAKLYFNDDQMRFQLEKP